MFSAAPDREPHPPQGLTHTAGAAGMAAPADPKGTGMRPEDLTLIENLATGQGQKELASALGISRTAVTARLARIKFEQGVPTTAELLTLYGRKAGLLESAERLESVRVAQPLDDAERHVNHVLDGMADYLRTRAAGLLP